MTSRRGLSGLVGGLGAGLLLAACSGKAGQWVGDYVTTNDFESVVGWSTDAGSLTKDHAHSGQYAVQVNQDREYGLTFDVPLAAASVHALRGIRVEAWAYLPGPQADAWLNVQIAPPQSPDAPVFRDGLRLLDQVHDYQKWTRVEKEFAFPANLTGDDHLRLFLWRGGSPVPVYLDDIKVRALE